MDLMRGLLEQLEAQARTGEDVRVALCYAAARQMEIDASELRAAARRALLVHAAGGDPTREPEPADPAVARFAADVGSSQTEAAFAGALTALEEAAAGLAEVTLELAALHADLAAAWRLAAAALLADELLSAD